MKFIVAFSFVLAAVGQVAHAQRPPKAPWALEPQSTPSLSVPADLRRAVGGELEYDDTEPMKGVAVDLDGDGIEDYLLQSAPSLCGNGGCVYVLCDGATRRKTGRFFGSPLVIQAERTHRYPNISTYSHLSAGSGAFTDYQFDGTTYVVTSTRVLEGAALERQAETVRRVPIWRPRQ
ncbi:MAG: hypothetical protein ABI665_12985 [Vicinamibacterales bacterium]